MHLTKTLKLRSDENMSCCSHFIYLSNFSEFVFNRIGGVRLACLLWVL